MIFERGNGVLLYTDRGDAYYDCISGIAVSSLGHSHPKLVKVLQEQAAKLWHTSNMFRVPAGEQLSKAMCDRTFADRVFFTNSGTESVECAMKAARKYHWANGEANRTKIVTLSGAFHGRSFAAINAGGNPTYLEGFGPAMAGFEQVPFGDINALEAAIDDETAAVLVEPVQGEGGVRAVPEAVLSRLRSLCTQNGALLIFDEIQCGMGRTGKLFSFEWAVDATPDIMCLAKGIGAGFPFGACLMTEKVGLVMQPGSHGSTYGGNPLAMAVGLEVWQTISEESFLEHVMRVSSCLHLILSDLRDRFPNQIAEVTGKGLLAGLKLNDAPKQIQALCRERRLLVGVAGNNVLRLAPPLIVTEAEIEAIGNILMDAFTAQRTQQNAHAQ